MLILTKLNLALKTLVVYFFVRLQQITKCQARYSSVSPETKTAMIQALPSQVLNSIISKIFYDTVTYIRRARKRTDRKQ